MLHALVSFELTMTGFTDVLPIFSALCFTLHVSEQVKLSTQLLFFAGEVQEHRGFIFTGSHQAGSTSYAVKINRLLCKSSFNCKKTKI